jgi:type IV pilus assembly protein PilM
LNKLVAEIQRSFDYYENTIKKSPIAKVVLSGGTSRLPNLDKYLAEKLHLEVALQDPFRNIVIPARQFDPGFIQKNSQLFIISLGLALRQGE